MLKHALVAGFVSLTISSASAQTRPLAPQPVAVVVAPVRPAFCPEGRLPNGTCQNPKLAGLARLTSCLTTQGAISFSAGPPCTTVIQDHDYRYPNLAINDTKRQLDIALNRQSGSFRGYGIGLALIGTPIPVLTPVLGDPRTGPGTNNPPRYPLY